MLMPYGFSLLARKKRPPNSNRKTRTLTRRHFLRHTAPRDHHHQRAERGTRLSKPRRSSICMIADVYDHLFARGDDGAELAAAEMALLA